MTSFIRAQAPDIVLVSPLVDLASPLLEYLKAARRLGIRTGICVASWDNLTSKGLLRFVPERVFVWNETQRREAVELHGIPADRIVATGAARFDGWFARRPSSSREQFIRKVGLDPDRPFLLYLCSSRFIAPDEVAAATRWLEALRGAPRTTASDPPESSSGRIRNGSRSGRTSTSHDSGTRPSGLRPGSAFDSAEAEADFYDSIAHCAAVVGVNTSAMIEAAIVGKSVYTWLAPEFAQEGTIHFHYLLHEHGGFLHVAESLDEHLAAARRQARQAERQTPNGPADSSSRSSGPAAPSAARPRSTRTRSKGSCGLPPPGRSGRWARLALRLALTPFALVSSLALGRETRKDGSAQPADPARPAPSGGSRGSGLHAHDGAPELDPLARRGRPEAAPAPPLRILFSLLHPGYLRHYARADPAAGRPADTRFTSLSGDSRRIRATSG